MVYPLGTDVRTTVDPFPANKVSTAFGNIETRGAVRQSALISSSNSIRTLPDSKEYLAAFDAHFRWRTPLSGFFDNHFASPASGINCNRCGGARGRLSPDAYCMTASRHALENRQNRKKL